MLAWNPLPMEKSHALRKKLTCTAPFLLSVAFLCKILSFYGQKPSSHHSSPPFLCILLIPLKQHWYVTLYDWVTLLFTEKLSNYSEIRNVTFITLINLFYIFFSCYFSFSYKTYTAQLYNCNVLYNSPKTRKLMPFIFSDVYVYIK